MKEHLGTFLQQGRSPTRERRSLPIRRLISSRLEILSSPFRSFIESTLAFRQANSPSNLAEKKYAHSVLISRTKFAQLTTRSCGCRVQRKRAALQLTHTASSRAFWIRTPRSKPF